jgi:hypothetical protein
MTLSIFLLTESIESLLHGAYLVGMIPFGRQYRVIILKSLFVIELISIYSSFYLCGVSNKWLRIMIWVHLIFHTYQNLCAMIKLPPLGKPMNSIEKSIETIIVGFDFSVHSLYTFMLFNMISLPFKIVVIGSLWLLYYLFPFELMTESTRKKIEV